jgi:hypothetical protein
MAAYINQTIVIVEIDGYDVTALYRHIRSLNTAVTGCIATTKQVAVTSPEFY